MNSLSNMSMAIMVAMVFMFLQAPPVIDGAISCNDVTKDLRPCLNYLVKGTGLPPADCCAGVSTLASAATTTADKRTACSCIKSAYQKVNPNPQLAQSLPANCGISLPYTISPNIDCSKIT